MPTYILKTKPSYEIDYSDKSSFIKGTKHEFTLSLFNETKLALGTEITGGFKTSFNIGAEVEYKHPLTKKYEIDVYGDHVSVATGYSSNSYNETQFRATAGNRTPKTPIDALEQKLVDGAKIVGYLALALQIAAAIVTLSFALTEEKVDEEAKEKPVAANFWEQTSTKLVEGFSITSLALAFIVSFFLDFQTRKALQRFKSFLNMHKTTGIMMGVKQDDKEHAKGSWYQQNDDQVEIGFSSDVEFDGALATVTPVGDHAKMLIDANGVQLNGGKEGIKNTVPSGKDFLVNVVGDTRLRVNNGTTELLRPSSTSHGLTMSDTKVRLSLSDKADLVVEDNEVNLKVNADTSLSLATDTAKLIAKKIELTATEKVVINSAEFMPGAIVLGDLRVVTFDAVAKVISAEKLEVLKNSKDIADSIKTSAQAAADALALQATTLKDEITRQLGLQLNDFTAQIQDLKKRNSLS